MVKSDLLQIHGVGEYAVDALAKDGVTNKTELREALRTLRPSAGHIYSSFQLQVLDELDLPVIGAQTVSQYTRLSSPEGEIRYEWDRDAETFVLELREEADEFRAEWFSTGEEAPFRSGRYQQRSDAVDALTRWAYRPPESA